MTTQKAKRGRPIGTGIDDSDRIARLAELLRVQPEMKPTTAIRVMGFSDPSTIRRLRDKYKAFQNSTSATAANSNTGALRTPRKTDAVVIAGTSQLMR